MKNQSFFLQRRGFVVRDISALIIMIFIFFGVGIILGLVVVTHPELLDIVKEIVVNRKQRF